ncbi:MAG: hypothetical protein OER86_03665 [Phycisphaerae bacterium]|nr:hypothetical protein [Phycisphaerae bacterium]
MSTEEQRTIVKRVDYQTTFRFTRLFECFRLAINPSRLLLALLFIVLVYIGGRVLDGLWGQQVVEDVEFSQYLSQPPDQFAKWQERMADTADGGVFAEVLSLKLGLFQRLVSATVNLDLGFDRLAPGSPPDMGATPTVIGTLKLMFLSLPSWLWQAHTGFCIVFLVLVLALWALLGGAICRQTVCEAARGQGVGSTESVRFSWKRWVWFIVSPLLPLLLILLMAFGVALGGLSFNFYVLDIVAGLLFVLALGVGFLMAMLAVGWLGGVHLMYPALVAEGTDGFDAVARSYSYVLARPWRLAAYSLVALVYGAVTYLLLGVFLFLVISLTHSAAGAWVFSEVGEGASAQALFPLMFPDPEFGNLTGLSADSDYSGLAWSSKAAATLIMVWVYLVISVLGAYAISYYFSAYSVIYLLLREQTDGTDYSEVYDEPVPPPPAPADKVEPDSGSSESQEGTEAGEDSASGGDEEPEQPGGESGGEDEPPPSSGA